MAATRSPRAVVAYAVAVSAKGDLRLLGGDPLTLDPALAPDSGSAGYIVEIFGGLVTLDKNLQDRAGPGRELGRQHDGKIYTFQIRKNAKFHDGRAVTADDVKYSLDRAAKLGQTTSTTAEAYLGDIVGASDVIRGKATAISRRQGRRRQHAADHDRRAEAVLPGQADLPDRLRRRQAAGRVEPAATGRASPTAPARTSWRSGASNERIMLEANDNYHLGAPMLQARAYNLAGGSSLTQYENNDIDVIGRRPRRHRRVCRTRATR